MLDLNLLEQFFGADSRETYYLDRQTGEVLASQDMFPELIVPNGTRMVGTHMSECLLMKRTTTLVKA